MVAFFRFCPSSCVSGSTSQAFLSSKQLPAQRAPAFLGLQSHPAALRYISLVQSRLKWYQLSESVVKYGTFVRELYSTQTSGLVTPCASQYSGKGLLRAHFISVRDCRVLTVLHIAHEVRGAWNVCERPTR